MADDWADRMRLRIARDLRDVQQLCRYLRVQAWHAHSDDEIMPGADAMVMLGPVATMSRWQEQVDELEQRYFDAKADGFNPRWPEIEDRDTDPQPPLLVLAGWEDIVREERGQQTTARATIKRACRYLLDSVDWMLDEGPAGPNFLPVEEFARELTALVRRLEAILHDGEQVDRGVPCMTCGSTLVKVWGESEDDDRWHCRKCHQWSTVEQYNLAVKAAHRKEADRLNATDMEAQYRIKPGTLTGWASTGKVRKRGKDQSGRVLYDVDDALTQRDMPNRETSSVLDAG